MPQIARRTLALQAPPARPAPRPSFVDVLSQLTHVSDAKVKGRLCLRHATFDSHAPYGRAILRVPRATTCDFSGHIDRSGVRAALRRGTLRLSQPVIIDNLVEACVAPTGMGRLIRPLFGWSVSYVLRGASIDGRGKVTLQGEARLFKKLPSRLLTRQVQRTVGRRTAKPHAHHHHGRSRRAQLSRVNEVFGNLIPRLVKQADIEIGGSGMLPPMLDVEANRQCVHFQGGPYRISTRLHADIDRSARASVVVGNAPGTHLLGAGAIRLDAQAHAFGQLSTLPRGGLRYVARGGGTITAPGMHFQLRDNEAPVGSGIRVIGGDVRGIRPVLPAMHAPFAFTMDNTAYRMRGRSQIHASALFMREGEAPPPLHDESMSLGVRSELTFGLHNTPDDKPQLDAAGKVALQPDGADAFYYDLSVKPGETSFEPVDD